MAPSSKKLSNEGLERGIERLFDDVAVLCAQDRAAGGRVLENIIQRSSGLKNAFWPEGLPLDGGQTGSDTAKGRESGRRRNDGLRRAYDKRHVSFRKDYTILRRLEQGNGRAIGVNEIVEALEAADFEVKRGSLITKLGRMKKDYEYIAWDDSSNAMDIRITDAGREYLKKLGERLLSATEVKLLDAAVAEAIEKLR